MKENLWNSNIVQFSRLIAELETAGAFDKKMMKILCSNMDTKPCEIMEIVERACNNFDIIKTAIRKGRVKK